MGAHIRYSKTTYASALIAFAAIFAGCEDAAPDDPGMETPAILEVFNGEMGGPGNYADAVEAQNRKNEERRRNGDWRHVRPAVGAQE